MPLTISEAIGIFERAFSAKNSNEIERILRDNLNIQVAVVEAIKSAENKINKGHYPSTIRVPYWVFVSKIKEKEDKLKVYSLEQENIISEEDRNWKLQEIYSPSNILPFKTYFLLKSEAGYYPDLGLTFDGDGEATGFKETNKSEKTEKFSIGRKQTWEEHSLGVCSIANRILKIYKVFFVDWAKSVFSIQNLSEEQIEETVEAIVMAIKISALLHDVGKLRRKWQKEVGWKDSQPYIARTSDKHKVPFHAPYAYPFLKELLRKIIGEHRILDIIALATARHHSLEVTGSIKENDFNVADKNVVSFLSKLLLKAIPELEGYNLDEIIQCSIEKTNKGSPMDEPPAPSDDFYFIYTTANRTVKLADWEDAGNEIIELPEVIGEEK